MSSKPPYRDSLCDEISSHSMLLQVCVPDGLVPGMAMTVASPTNEEFTITVPDGCQAGDLIDVDLPVSDSTMHETQPLVVTVVVPDGCRAGDIFSVEFDGKMFDIGVPDGCHGGDEIQVEVPEEAPSEQHPWRPPPPPEPHVGERAMVCGLITNGLLNGRKGSLISFDAEKGLFKLAIDKMFPYVAIRAENLIPLPWEEEPDTSNDEEPLEAPRAGVHYVGDRVMVERSNGRTSLATLVEYDEVFETYTVDVGNGMLKYGVEESYITPKETSNEWAGPNVRAIDGSWEGFYVGRRVRIPLGPRSGYDSDDEDDDRNGKVRSYDKRSGLYCIELDSGLLRRDVPYKHIKVVYRMGSGAMV